MRHIGVKRNKLPTVFRADTDGGHNNFARGRIDDLCRANVNLAAFVNDKRQCDGNRDREDLRDLPVGVIRFICGFRENVIFRYLRTAVRFGKPSQKICIFACRLDRQHQLFDVQVKRLHEYKRQLLNALCIMDLYLSIKDGTLSDFTPTAFIFGAKAAPGYRRAKAIIHYVNRIAELINNDPAMEGVMKVVFVQNYNCSYAEHIIPAADISEQISPAGTEASGTGNMKLMLNGAVTLGTLDGANVEIAEQAGRENEYIFGATVEEINMVKPNYNARSFYEADPALRRAVDTLIDGTVPTDEEQHELYTSLLKGASWHKPDQYFLFYDFDSYKKARLQANRDYRDRLSFGRKCLENVASAGKFSSDRTIRQYADEIWHIKPVK